MYYLGLYTKLEYPFDAILRMLLSVEPEISPFSCIISEI